MTSSNKKLHNIIYQIIGIIAIRSNNHLWAIDATSFLTSTMALKLTSMSHFVTNPLKIVALKKHVGNIKTKINIGDFQDDIGIIVMIIINSQIGNTKKNDSSHINISAQDIKKNIKMVRRRVGGLHRDNRGWHRQTTTRPSTSAS